MVVHYIMSYTDITTWSWHFLRGLKCFEYNVKLRYVIITVVYYLLEPFESIVLVSKLVIETDEGKIFNFYLYTDIYDIVYVGVVKTTNSTYRVLM